MGIQQEDQAIVSQLEQLTRQQLRARVEHDGHGHVIKLSLAGFNLTQVPGELAQLSNLRTLSLRNNQLTQVPIELERLSNLQELDLSGNQLT
jgi:Leucine-rich repeat (LRR) protein